MLAALSLLLPLGAAGCASTVREDPPPFCSLSRAGQSEEARRRDPSDEELLRLVLGPNARFDARAPDADCAGAPTAAAQTECEPRLAELPLVSLSRASILSRSLPDGRRIVWIVTRSDGREGEGPIALVERREESVVAKVQGVVRADLGRARFKLASNERVLVVESERCEDPNDPSSCERTAQLLVRNGNRFVREPIRDRRTGRCLNGPFIALSRRTTRALADGWERSFLATSSFEDSADGLVVHETVSMRDRDPALASVPSRPFRDVSSDRQIVLGSGLVGDEVPLLERTLVDLGSVAVPERRERDE